MKSASNGNGRAQPHHRLTLKDVVRDYKNKLLTVKGAIFYAVSSSRKQGEAVRLDPNKIAEQLEAHKATVYRAIAQLQVENRIEVETEGTLLIRIPVEKNTGTPNYIFLEELSHERDSQSHKCDDLSHERENLSHERENLSHKRDDLSHERDKKTSEPAPQAEPGSPQSIQSLQSLLSSQGDRDLESDPEFENWLRHKANYLPQKPALLEQWIERQKQNAANQREYLQYQETRQLAASPENLPSEEILDPSEYWRRVHERSGHG